MEKIKIRAQGAKKINKGYPLIEPLDLANSSDQEKTKRWVQFTSLSGEFLATGYLGKQNKGIGWTISRNISEKIDGAFFNKLFQAAIEKRHGLINSDETTAFRFFNGEGDGIGGLTIDIYEEYALFTWYNDSLYAFRELIFTSFSEVYRVYAKCRGMYEKNRFEGTGIEESQHVQGEQAPTPVLIKENGVTYATYLDEGMMTGIFLDQKNVRERLVDGLATNMDVLNTFSYTGAFSVAAAMGGAKSTVSVDLAKRSLEKTKEMFEVNKLPLENNKIVVMDIFDYIRYAQRKMLSFDMIILDPPGFARNKKKTFSVVKNYGELVGDVVSLIRKKGYLIASTNVANLAYSKFVDMVEVGIKQQKRSYKLVETHRLPNDFATITDFPDGNYLKVLIYQLDS